MNSFLFFNELYLYSSNNKKTCMQEIVSSLHVLLCEFLQKNYKKYFLYFLNIRMK